MWGKDKFRPDLAKGDEIPPPKGFKERMYDKVKLPLWALDAIIAVLILGLIAVIIIGTR